ncbi:preprotein translocase subunit YajC [Corynebacterium pyruviciproducens]|uniref:preprotein translocase subunit YajC n=1 Tax=Corynebacterium pyruviciproducens TaxID=598660 RepID=UPI0023F4179A|nr:preprotein translocase subunit YajC [Corynebacterium pyruviciproducens]MDH4658393.1 preprotein translocase subunit YajC [Corynebacterium pyruviciproducens]MDK6566049.1 preprotein translocase subunit YajC [Corynebacterium pyruviciproducens]
MDLLILLVILAIFAAPMFLMQRKQKRQMDELRTMQGQLKPGDHVVTTAGLHAFVNFVDDTEVDLELAHGVITRWEKIAIVKKIDEPTTTGAANTDVDNVEGEAPSTDATDNSFGDQGGRTAGEDTDR